MVGHHPPKVVLSDPEDEDDPGALLGTGSGSPTGSKGGAGEGGGERPTLSAAGAGAPTALPVLTFMAELPWRLFLANRCFWALLWAHTVGQWESYCCY